MRLTEAEYKAVLQKQKLSRSEVAALGGKAKANKYRAIQVEVDGIRFPSRKEAAYYGDLKMLKATGAIRGFARQVKLPMPSGKRWMLIDFLVIELDGRVRWIDTKGVTLKDWAVKKDELEHSLGITIEVV